MLSHLVSLIGKRFCVYFPVERKPLSLIRGFPVDLSWLVSVSEKSRGGSVAEMVWLHGAVMMSIVLNG